MNPNEHIETLKELAKSIQEGIDSKNRDITLLKAALKFDCKRLKATNEEMEFYKGQVTKK